MEKRQASPSASIKLQSHLWEGCSHVRPTYCNVCTGALSGVMWTGLSCQICKLRCHKHCAPKIALSCKWTTFETIDAELVKRDSNDQTSCMPHQWIRGNLPLNSKCAVCESVCGSVLRLQDFKCIWCRVTVHESCRPLYAQKRCSLGSCQLSVLPPDLVKNLSIDGSCESLLAGNYAQPRWSPLLVLVNTKSGDGRRGLNVFRRFRQLLNPIQVHDLANGGADFSLKFFANFAPFRVLVCGGDGSVSWVLMCIDRFGLLEKCQVGVLPLGTGNDLARVLGWGHSFDDTDLIASMIRRFERAHVKPLDRWSVLVHEDPSLKSIKFNSENPKTSKSSFELSEAGQSRKSVMNSYQSSVADHISQILSSSDYAVVISSARILCETVKNFISDIGTAFDQSSSSDLTDATIADQCGVLRQKLDNLVLTLKEESDQARLLPATSDDKDKLDVSGNTVKEFLPPRISPKREFVERERLMIRADSLKKAVKQIIDHASKAIDEQNIQTTELNDSQLSTTRSYTIKSPSRRLIREKLSLFSLSPRKSPKKVSRQSSFDSSNPERSSFQDFDLDSDIIPEDPVHSLPSTSATPQRSVSSVIGKHRRFPMVPMRFSRQTLIHSDSQQLSSNNPCCSTSVPENLPLVATLNCMKNSFSEAVFPENEPDKSAAKRHSLALDGVKNFENSMDALSTLHKKLMRTTVGGDIIRNVLMLNSDMLQVSYSPSTFHLPALNVPLCDFAEKKVMNNYFSIGLDAKIALDFHNRREENEKTRSRSKLFMLYGMLATKELWSKTYKNLEQRVLLECDDRKIRLPSLQGIVVLNIPSYQGGANFWGTDHVSNKKESRIEPESGDSSITIPGKSVYNDKENGSFSLQCFHDQMLEVVAVFGVLHCAKSRLIKLHNHRIAQCHTVRITITGQEPIPVQVDGEAWLQSAGRIQIMHKNQAHVLTSKS